MRYKDKVELSFKPVYLCLSLTLDRTAYFKKKQLKRSSHSEIADEWGRMQSLRLTLKHQALCNALHDKLCVESVTETKVIEEIVETLSKKPNRASPEGPVEFCSVVQLATLILKGDNEASHPERLIGCSISPSSSSSKTTDVSVMQRMLESIASNLPLLFSNLLEHLGTMDYQSKDQNHVLFFFLGLLVTMTKKVWKGLHAICKVTGKRKANEQLSNEDRTTKYFEIIQHVVHVVHRIAACIIPLKGYSMEKRKSIEISLCILTNIDKFCSTNPSRTTQTLLELFLQCTSCIFDVMRNTDGPIEKKSLYGGCTFIDDQREASVPYKALVYVVMMNTMLKQIELDSTYYLSSPTHCSLSNAIQTLLELLRTQVLHVTSSR